MEWTEKYRPKHLKDVVGNERLRALMFKWGEGWMEGCPLRETCKPPEKERIKKKRALILAGPPGIGKTTSALALANDMGWSVIEMNASDTRNAEAVKRIAMQGAMSQGFTEDGEYVRAEEGERKLIILDEADNLSGNSDRGGVRAIADVVRNTRQPVILIVNDLYALQRRSSFFKGGKASPIEILRFKRPETYEVEEFLLKVAEEEGLDIDRDVIYEIAARAAGDVRGALNDLQSFAYSDVDVDDVVSAGTRDRELDVGEALKMLYSSGSISKGTRYLMSIDEEPRNTLLWIDELIPKLAYRSRERFRAFEHLSMADVYLSRVFRRQQYSLWKYATDEMAASLAFIKDRGEFPRSFFPKWLIEMSRSRNSRALRESLAMKLAVHLHTTTNRAMQDVFPAFQILFLRDEDFRKEMIWMLELEEKEVAFLLEDKELAKVEVERARAGKKKEEASLSGTENVPEKKEKEEPKEEKELPPGQQTLF